MLANRSAPPVTVTPVLIYPDVRAAVAWLESAFGFEERVRIGEGHRAQLRVGSDGAVVVADVRAAQVAPRAGVVTQLIKVRVRGRLAWFVRRTYYLLQMPGWGRRLRIMIDWTFALLFRPDIVKISLDSEAALILREAATGEWRHGHQTGTQPAAVAGSAAPPALAAGWSDAHGLVSNGPAVPPGSSVTSA